MHDKLVFAADQIFRGEFVRDEHIVRASDQSAVEINIRIGVKPLKDELLLFRIGHLKGTPVPEVQIFPFLREQGIFSVENIPDQARTHKVDLKIAGHLCRHTGKRAAMQRADRTVFRGGRKPFVLLIKKLPIAVQRYIFLEFKLRHGYTVPSFGAFSCFFAFIIT